jgi:hypothetical protein
MPCVSHLSKNATGFTDYTDLKISEIRGIILLHINWQAHVFQRVFIRHHGFFIPAYGFEKFSAICL